MFSKRIKRIFIGILTFVIIGLQTVSFFHATLFRKSYIEKMLRIDLPKSAKLIDYSFGISVDGAEPFYAKLELSQDDFEEFIKYSPFNEVHQKIFDYIREEYTYKLLNFEELEDFRVTERITGKYAFFYLAGSTRVIYGIFTKEGDRYFLYVVYW